MRQFCLALALLTTAINAHADVGIGPNIIRVKAPVSHNAGSWATIDPAYGTWTDTGSPSSCSDWSPAAGTVVNGTSFTQSRTCQQSQQRSVQPQERNSKTSAVRAVGAPTLEQRSVTVSSSQTAVGTKVETVCRHTDGSNWITAVNGNYISVYWDNVYIQSSPSGGDPAPVTSFTYKNELYTRGALFKANDYYVCKG